MINRRHLKSRQSKKAADGRRWARYWYPDEYRMVWRLVAPTNDGRQYTVCVEFNRELIMEGPSRLAHSLRCARRQLREAVCGGLVEHPGCKPQSA